MFPLINLLISRIDLPEESLLWLGICKINVVTQIKKTISKLANENRE